MLTDCLGKWSPSPEPLLQLAIAHNDDSMLREIAYADYGMESDAHYAAIMRLIEQRDFTARLEWTPREVLELTRWSEPDDPNRNSESPSERGHWMRLFSCTFLLRSAAEFPDYFAPGEDSTIIQLVASSIALGNESAQAALKLLCWRLQIDLAKYGESPYFAMGTLLLAVFVCDYDRERLELLMKLIAPEWMYSYLSPFGIREDTWRALLESIVLNAPVNDIDYVKVTVAEVLS